MSYDILDISIRRHGSEQDLENSHVRPESLTNSSKNDFQTSKTDRKVRHLNK